MSNHLWARTQPPVVKNATMLSQRIEGSTEYQVVADLLVTHTKEDGTTVLYETRLSIGTNWFPFEGQAMDSMKDTCLAMFISGDRIYQTIYDTIIAEYPGGKNDRTFLRKL